MGMKNIKRASRLMKLIGLKNVTSRYVYFSKIYIFIEVGL